MDDRNIKEILQKQRAFFHSGHTKDVAYRKAALKKLRSALHRYESRITEALALDLNRGEADTFLAELIPSLYELDHALKHLDRWTRPKKVRSPAMLFGASGRIYAEPYGTVLIIVPWNYPINLCIAPLVGALAAGNTVVIKPSELAPNASRILFEMIAETFPSEYVAVVEGGIETSTALLRERFDYIFFTGSTAVGKVVMEAAAKHLTPVTLELGGKSPTIVHRDADLPLAAKRIVWAKCMNAGQTCVAPDYALVHEEVHARFLKLLSHEMEAMYPEALTNGKLNRLVNQRHYERVLGYLTRGTMIYGGRSDAMRLLLEPTILIPDGWEDPVMTEEIFGPILPVISYKQLSDAIEQISKRPKPLALYVFSQSSEVQQTIMEQLSFGGGCINDCITHLVHPGLPFGGVGDSGMGAYHGQTSFDLFSHRKSVLTQTTRFDFPFRYMQSGEHIRLLKRLLRL
jgi:aldehyde dehydrogenase (NAD+)